MVLVSAREAGWFVASSASDERSTTIASRCSRTGRRWGSRARAVRS